MGEEPEEVLVGEDGSSSDKLLQGLLGVTLADVPDVSVPNFGTEAHHRQSLAVGKANARIQDLPSRPQRVCLFPSKETLPLDQLLG